MDIKLTLNEVNEIINSLSKLPYVNVFQVIELLSVKAKQATEEEPGKTGSSAAS